MVTIQHTEVQIHHDVPRGLAVVDGTAEAQDLTGQKPPDEANGVAALVVGGDGNVDKVGWRVGVAQSNDGDVDVAGLLDGLGVGAGVRHNNQAGLLERTGDVVGEGTGGKTTGNGLGAGVRGELEDSALAVGTGRDNADIGRVVDSGDNAGSQDNLLPGLANVDHIDTIGTGLPQVRVHVHLQVLGANVALGGQQVLNVLRGGSEAGGEVVGRHRSGCVRDVGVVEVVACGGKKRSTRRSLNQRFAI